MAKVVFKKKYKIKPRFFVWIMIGLFSISLTTACVKTFAPTNVPNFYGWCAEDVIAYNQKNDELSITYELVYSYDILHNHVIKQEVKGQNAKKTTVVVYVSKGYPLMENFENKTLLELKEFADTTGLQVETNLVDANQNGTISSQSIPWGSTLLKNSKLEVTIED